MKNDKIGNYLKNIPTIKHPSINMPEANMSISIHKGVFYLQVDQQNQIEIKGEISYHWFPNSGARFNGELQIVTKLLFNLANSLKSYMIFIDGLKVGEFLISGFHHSGSNSMSTISGVSVQTIVLGDGSIPFKKLSFSLPNLKEFDGNPIKENTDKIIFGANRLIFEDDTFKINIDKCFDYKIRRENLREKGGYIILYGGELETKKGSIRLAETRMILSSFSIFLSFINGNRTSALFLSGFKDSTRIWCDYTDYYVDSFKMTSNWSHSQIFKNGSTIWNQFQKTWSKEGGDDFLKSAIHWYTEANRQSGSIEGSLIMAQTALELIYNWWIIEDKELLKGKDSEDIKAANKIRLLLSQVNLKPDIPAAFSQLADFAKSISNIEDAPDAIVYIRNAIVHSQKEKRKMLNKIAFTNRYQALQISLWYIELALLCILKYNGTYINRCSAKDINIDPEQYVPWAKPVI